MSIEMFAVIIVACAAKILTQWLMARANAPAPLCEWVALVVMLVIFVMAPSHIG